MCISPWLIATGRGIKIKMDDYIKQNKVLTPLAQSLRRGMTKEERHLWYDFLRDYPIGFKRQKVYENYILDFYCREAGLVIELDGSQHYEEENIKKDAKRTELLESHGLMVIRIPNNELNMNFEGVCQYIDHIVQQRLNKK